MATKYRKKPVTIEAMQVTPDNVNEVAQWAKVQITTIDGRLKINTLEGTMVAEWDDFVIKGIQGEFYPCKPDIFEASYEEVKNG